MISCWSVSGQQFSFKVETTGFTSNEVIYLKKYHGSDEIPVDSVRGSGKSKFTINSAYGINGLYFISISRSENAELLINEGELGLVVSVSKDGIGKGELSILNSKENDAYEKFVELYLAYEQAFYTLANKHFDEFDPKLISNIDNQTKSLESIQRSFNSELKLLANEYPKTFTAEVLCPLAALPIRTIEYQSNYETYQAFLNRHFWSEANLNDSRLLNHFLLNESLKNYFRFFLYPNEKKK